MPKWLDKTLARQDRRRAKRSRTKIVGFIPARGGSQGVPKKNLAPLAGYPLVAHAILALQVAGMQEVYVSTDSNEIAETSELYGARSIERPGDLAQPDSPTEGAIRHFFANVRCDAIAMVQCTSPMLSPAHIRLAVNKFLAHDYDCVFTVVETNDTLIWDANLKPINYDPRRRSTRQRRTWSLIYIETGGLYCIRKSMFLREQCRIGGKVGIQKVPSHQAFQIDGPKDLKLVRKLMETK